LSDLEGCRAGQLLLASKSGLRKRTAADEMHMHNSLIAVKIAFTTEYEDQPDPVGGPESLNRVDLLLFEGIFAADFREVVDSFELKFKKLKVAVA
jgi:hypothetical protein